MLTTPDARELEYNSLEVIDLTEIHDNIQPNPITQQVICLSERAPYAARDSTDRTLIVLSDEEAETTSIATVTENNRSTTNRAAPFRNYMNAPVFDYDFIRDLHMDEASSEGSVYFPSSESDLDPEDGDLQPSEFNGFPETNTSLVTEGAALPEPFSDGKPTEGGENNMGIKCSICLDNPQKLTTTICGHLFCDECIHRSIKTPSKACPVCRKPLTLKKMRILQLRVLPTAKGQLSRRKRSTSEESESKKRMKSAS
ncbi:hypothetical protein K493DRAFT_338971 [Basidiobolus meristosporus CBS 931.73]|uniref:RING-type domain-containing protein n=1 Tax=Basidiobolus meristosporus CBS 931.73 TaxID=1314790 RepID=A0A1Y1Y3H1_9FUNG|nr:hypothetical protein K493DRAFT_338971 [Basidiobolus meristosporus CBS 931.73]|eukprot:ORX92144.1 hypothetical protein K493DRAFT_338971 [Basidiobolus meristosporus CBS 931.73]